MATQGEYQQRRYMWLVQLYPNILKALLLASLINGDYGVHGQHHQRNYQCHEEGYHADPSDCQMYYRCVAWGNNSPLTKFDFKCGPGTVFSHANGDICVHPRESERTECQESENDLDSNMNYPQSNQGSFPSYGQPPVDHSYQQPQAPPNYGTPPPNRPNYQHTQTSFNYGEQTTRPSYGSPQSSTSYKPSYSSSSTESPFNNEIDQPAYFPASQSPQFTSSHSPPTATTADNSIPHPISTTTNAGIANGQSECQREGFFTNSNDCKKFIRCVDDGRGSYLKYDFTCGEGTVWDPTTEGCNHAWAVSRDDCRTPSQDIGGDSNGNNGQDVDQSQSGGGDHHNDMTSQLPWTPDADQAPIYPSYPSSQSPNGYPVPSATMAAPVPPAYIPPSETTSQSSLATSASSTPLETENNASMPPDFASSPSGSTNGDGSPPESSSVYPGSTDSSASSSSDCLEEGFFADPNDCMKFYRCVQDVNSLKKYDFSCGEGTAWDQSIQGCNHKYAVNSCSGKDHNNEQTTVSSGGDGSNPSSESDKELETSTQDQRENELGVTNPSTLTEPPTKVETSSNPPSSSETPTTITDMPSKPTTPKPSPTIGEPSTENIPKPEEMPQSSEAPRPTTPSEEPSPTTTVSSESNKDQETTTQEIDKDQSSATNSPSASNSSESSSIPESSSSLPTTQSSTPESSSMKPEESSKPTSEKEPSSTSTKPPSSNKPNGPTGDADCKEEGFLPHPNDCRKFLRCVSTGDNGYTKYTFDCGPGTAWDQSLLTCNYIEKVASCGSVSNEIPSGPEGNEQMSTKPTNESTSTSTTASKEEQGNGNDITPTTGSNQDEKSTTESSSSSSTESGNLDNSESTSKSPDTESSQNPNGSGNCTTTKPTNNGIVCDVEGFHANPTYCGKFYRCVDNGNGFNVYHFDCPGGTIFDPSINVCNYPESVYPQRNCDGDGASGGSSTSQVPDATSSTENPSPTESGEETTTAEASSESGSESISTEETVTESMTELIGGEETSTESATELTDVEGTSSESATESTGTTESVTETKITIGEETTDASTEAGITEMQTTTELSQESSMTTENAPTTEASSESSAMTDLPTDSSTTDSSESTPPSLETTTVGKTDGDNMATPCPIGNLTDEQIVLVCPTGFRRHPKYCNMFYQCSTEDDMKIKVLVLGCPEGTIYDEEKIQCRPESESSQKCDTQMASSRFYRQLEKTSVSPIRVRRTTLCPDEGHFPYQQGCSDAFYKCSKNSRNELQGYLYRCPKDYVYWSVSRRCERANRMICSHGKYEEYERIYSWENRWDLPIEQSNVSS